MKNHSYSVEIRISGEMLNLSEVSNDFHLTPIRSWSAGDTFLQRVRKDSMWAFNGSDKEEEIEWDSIEEGLNYVLNKISDRKHVLERYKQTFEVYWWCGYFQSSFDGGPSLSPMLLTRLADLGVELILDCHFVSDEGEDVVEEA